MKHFFVPAILSMLLFSCNKKDQEDLPPTVYIGEGSSINNIALSKSLSLSGHDTIFFDYYARIEKGSKEIKYFNLVRQLPFTVKCEDFLIDDFEGDTLSLNNSDRAIPINDKGYYHFLIKIWSSGNYRSLVRAKTEGRPGDAVINLDVQD